MDLGFNPRMIAKTLSLLRPITISDGIGVKESKTRTDSVKCATTRFADGQMHYSVTKICERGATKPAEIVAGSV